MDGPYAQWKEYTQTATHAYLYICTYLICFVEWNSYQNQRFWLFKLASSNNRILNKVIFVTVLSHSPKYECYIVTKEDGWNRQITKKLISCQKPINLVRWLKQLLQPKKCYWFQSMFEGHLAEAQAWKEPPNNLTTFPQCSIAKKQCEFHIMWNADTMKNVLPPCSL